MRDELSIESLKGKIFSAKTSEYFEEVYSSYIHGNYRSAVVMLWSVVVLDIVQKVQSLKDSYEDKVAIKILEDIDSLNSKDRKSSVWELTIIKEVCDRTDLIEDSEYTNLEYLQKQRHLSAHPIIRSGVDLYVPNKDTTRALIRNALEIVLIKPPVYTDRILHTILTDLAENGDAFTSLEELKSYVQYKYLNRITRESKLKLFEKFWKFVMQLENTDCDENRFQNLRFLILLAWDNIAEVKSRIENRIDFYSNIKNEQKFMNPLLSFLSRVPEVHALLNEETKILIGINIEKEMEFCVASTYMRKTLEEHYDYLESLFERKPCNIPLNAGLWLMLYERSDSIEMEIRCLESICLYYSQSESFDDADHAITNVIKFMDKFKEETFEYLLAKSEKKRNTYARPKAPEEYKQIKNRIIEMNKAFDFSNYKEFNKAVAKAKVA